ncbi:conserved exported hypothetical protein [Candidatus Desulfosporosinus infrequens]|uniref:Uncharacterized protein n=1 Tax=Candidatus Desulfosporosinus infrequens TaxID=2043169 RepID=A0A2U3LV28_9FIRM|nr:conserved exported hypothetical protein [Candidatus Desulfosporosinus infrequens]
MRKINYLVGALALGLGVAVGTLGVTLLTNSSSPASFISKLRGQDKIQTVAGAVSNPTQTSPLSNTAPDAPVGNNPPLDGTNLNSDSTSNSGTQQNDPLSLGQNDDNKNAAGLSPQNQEIITDYKQDIGIFFDAWKSVDMDSFRLKLAKAYTGELFEKHARRAEGYLVQGLGLDVSQITFDRVDIENADANTATIRADYRYTARDFNLADATPVGEAHEQNIHVRVNLLKQNSRWLITGESVVQ